MSVKDNNTIDEFMKNTLRNLTMSVKSSFELPTKGTSEESIFNEFPQYRKVVNGLSLKILNNIQSLIDKQDGKGNILDTGEKKALEDKFNILVEVNDRLLDRCNNLITSIENPEMNTPNSVVVLEYTSQKDKLVNDGSKMTPRQTIKLLSSVQIERPQLKFSKQPDNSRTFFRPLLKNKPNALRPLELYTDKETEGYTHPYELELEQLQISEEQLELPTNPTMPNSLENTPYKYIDTVEGLLSLVETLKQSHEIAVDIEHHSARTYLGLTCLVQISTRESDYIIDTIALHGCLESLNEIFTNPKIVKVFHGANSDVMWLQRDLGVYVINMFDTGQACVSLNYPRKSLSYLLERFCQVRANKEYQSLTDWRIRPLIPELVEYARSDTHYLLYIYDKMREELHNLGLVADVFEASKNICQLLYHKPAVTGDDCMELYRKSNEQFNPRQLYALKRLWELRDNIAREEDESAHFVLPNHILLSIAQVLPRETSGVLACCSQDWKLHLLRKYVYDFQKICLEAYNESMAKETRKPIVKSNILDILLSKHDKTHSDSVKVDINMDDVRKRINRGDVIFKKTVFSTAPEYAGIIKSFLAHHPTEIGAGGDKSVVVEEEEELEDDEEDVSGEMVDPVDVMIDLTDVVDDVDSAAIVKKKEEDACMSERPAKMRRINDVTPFDYTQSLHQLKEESRTNRKTKSFNPLVTKKFKKNQKGKK